MGDSQVYVGRLTGNGYESPIVKKSACKKLANRAARRSILVGIIQITLATFIYYEMNFHVIAGYFELNGSIIRPISVGLAILLTAVGLYNVLYYAFVKLFPTYIDITMREKSLLGIKDGDKGFQVSSGRKQASSSSLGNLKFSPSTSSHFAPLSSTNAYSSFMASNGSSLMSSAFAHPSSKLGSSVAAGCLDTTVSSSFSYSKPASPSPTTTRALTMDDSSTSAFLRRRISPRQSPTGKNDHFSSLEELDSYLEEQDLKEQTEQLGKGDTLIGVSPSFWTYSRSVSDYIPQLRKHQYQMAPRSPQSKATQNDDDPDHLAKYSSDEMWYNLGVHLNTLDVWTENLRYWLSQTIVQKLIKEIETVNKELARIGFEDQQIGEVGVSALRSVAYSKGQLVPSLSSIIPYLEVTISQDYLVHRVRELAKDGCIADFNWKGGSEFRGKAWDEHLPTDSAIIMHLLCTYMDSKMPVNPKYPDGKSFTAQHFMRTPTKPNFSAKKDYLCLYQTKESPPHYKVIIDTDVWDVAKGRCNMFHAVLRFLHHVKVQQAGMLGHVHLGLSGINMLSVLTDTTTVR